MARIVQAWKGVVALSKKAENRMKRFSIRSIIIIENTVDNKALRGNPSQNPTQRFDCEGLRQCDRYPIETYSNGLVVGKFISC
jgi:hypothetical protein